MSVVPARRQLGRRGLHRLPGPAPASGSTLLQISVTATCTGNQLFEGPADGWEDGVLAVSPTMFSDDTFVTLK